MNNRAYKQYNKPNPHNAYNNKQGFYTIQNPAKYMGDSSQIIYRSSLEYKFCLICDMSDSIIKWTSEPSEFNIQYFNPFKSKMSLYVPDYFIKVKKQDQISKYLIEVKPIQMMGLTPEDLSNNTKSGKQKVMNVILNRAKIKAAISFCQAHDIRYLMLTEKFFEKFGTAIKQ